MTEIKKIKVNGQEITIKEYNSLYYRNNHPILKRIEEVYEEIYGCRTGEGFSDNGSSEEAEKSRRVNRDLYDK